MPRIPRRRPNAYLTIFSLALVAAAVVWFGLPRVVGLSLGLLVIGLGLVYPFTMDLVRRFLHRRTLVVQGAQLVCRRPGGDIIGEVDLSKPFEAECLYVGHLPLLDLSGQVRLWGLYRVRQRATSFRFTSELDGAEEVVAGRLGLPWPPRAAVFWWP